MQYRVFENRFVLRLDPGEEVLSCITAICWKENIRLGTLTGLGAANLVEIGLFNTTTKQYHSHVFEGPFEITSLVGNISRKDNEVYLHLHITFGDEEYVVRGGHLNRCRISATSEICITAIDGEVGRKFDSDIGLNLFEM